VLCVHYTQCNIVELADGIVTVAGAKCTVYLRMRNGRFYKVRMRNTVRGVIYHKKMSAYVVDLGEDMDFILGDDWLVSEQVGLSYSRSQCIVYFGRKDELVLNPSNHR
jgi:hypothetical protein